MCNPIFLQKELLFISFADQHDHHHPALFKKYGLKKIPFLPGKNLRNVVAGATIFKEYLSNTSRLFISDTIVKLRGIITVGFIVFFPFFTLPVAIIPGPGY